MVADAIDGESALAVYAALLNKGAVPRMVGAKLGKVSTAQGATIGVEISMEAGPSVLYDAVVIPGGKVAIQQLSQDGNALEFIRLQHRHCKPMLVLAEAGSFLSKADVPAILPDETADPSIIVIGNDGLSQGIEKFMQALQTHRCYERETEPPAA